MEPLKSNIDRRRFIKHIGAGAGLLVASTGFPLSSYAVERPVRLGFVGVGGRGVSILRIALNMKGVEVTALCDIVEEKVARAQRMVEEAGQPKPEGYSRGPEDYKRLAEQENLDAIYTATPWDLHTPVMVAAMKAGKYGGTEMPACIGVEQAWELVETSEKTGMPCMLMENYCYMQHVQMILNMVNQKVFGELSHCEVGYQHDTRYVSINAKGELLWRAHDKLSHNGNRYPTHAIGPASQWLNVNRADRLDYLCMLDFVKAVRNRTEVPIDVYDAATWSVITELTETSVNDKSRPVDFPDFTRGQWETRKPKPIEPI